MLRADIGVAVLFGDGRRYRSRGESRWLFQPEKSSTGMQPAADCRPPAPLLNAGALRDFHAARARRRQHQQLVSAGLAYCPPSGIPGPPRARLRFGNHPAPGRHRRTRRIAIGTETPGRVPRQGLLCPSPASHFSDTAIAWFASANGECRLSNSSWTGWRASEALSRVSAGGRAVCGFGAV